MKRHVIALVLGIVLLLASLASLSCVPATSSASTQSTDSIAYKSDVAAVNARVDTQSQRIDAIAGKSGVDTQTVQNMINSSLAGYIKTSDLDAAIDIGIAAYLKAHPTVNTTTTEGNTTTTGGYAITLDHNQIISMASDTGNKDVSVSIVNQTGSDATPSLLISLVPLSPSTFDKAALHASTHRNLKSTLSGFTDSQDGTVQVNPDATSLLYKLYWISPEFSISNGSSKSIWLNFDVQTDSVVTWKLEIKAL